MSRRVLSLLGLALRGGRLAVGEEPVALAAKAGRARLILLASDAAGNTLRRAERLAQEGHCLHLSLPCAKAELGGALGRGSAAVAALTDTGLAAAVTARLAELDPERYAEAAARMDLKRRRAKERQSAPRRDPPKKTPPRRDSSPKRGDRRPPSPRREDRHPPDQRRRGRPEGPDSARRSRTGEARGPRAQGGRPGKPRSSRPPRGKPGHGRGGGR